jgi:hypothetical protein
MQRFFIKEDYIQCMEYSIEIRLNELKHKSE